jgi:hypothetical protein
MLRETAVSPIEPASRRQRDRRALLGALVINPIPIETTIEVSFQRVHP